MSVLDSGWLTTGSRAKEFEAAFAQFVGTRHAVAVNSATAALHLALDALAVGPQDEVIVPTWTFAATAEVVAYRGATPVLVDIDPATLNAPTANIAAAITDRTRTVIAVHFAGLPTDIENLVDTVTPRGVAVVEDAAHAFPSLVGSAGRLAGTIGRIGPTRSTPPRRLRPAKAECSSLTTRRSPTARGSLSLHGISRDAWNRYSQAGSWYYEIEDVGYKYYLTDIAAALGLAQLARATELRDSRRQLAASYDRQIAASSVGDLIDLPAHGTAESHAWHLYVIRLRLERLATGRAQVIESLKEHGIGTSVHFIPLHLHPYYRRRWSTTPEQFPVASREYERVISLPLWPGMSESDVTRVVAALENVVGRTRR